MACEVFFFSRHLVIKYVRYYGVLAFFKRLKEASWFCLRNFNNYHSVSIFRIHSWLIKRTDRQEQVVLAMICQTQITLRYKWEPRLEGLAHDQSRLYSKAGSNSNSYYLEKKTGQTSYKLTLKGFWLSTGLFRALSTFCKYSAFVERN